MQNSNVNTLPGLGNAGSGGDGLPEDATFWVDDAADQMVDASGDKFFFQE